MIARKVAHVTCVLLGMHMHVCVNMHVTCMLQSCLKLHACRSKGNMLVTWMLKSENVFYTKHDFSYLTGMIHACYMQITCPVQCMLARKEHLKYSI